MRHMDIKIIYKVIIGFIAMVLLFPIISTAQERLSVKTETANIRSGPGTKGYDILWQVERYHPFKVVEKKGKWFRVKDFENDEAWIHQSLLADIPSVITIKNKCNVRSKPTTKSSKLFTAERGVPFKVLKRQGNWINVKHTDGDMGWIYKTLVW